MIIPISCYLLWQRRFHLLAAPLRPSWSGLALTALGSLTWSAARFADIEELAQFAVIAMLQGMVIAALGWRFYAQAPIALLYCLLLVPSGEPLLPLLQTMTSRLAAAVVELAGIPVFRDGVAIEVPSGHYLVAPGCAGLNFLLAGLALALAFADLTYRDSWRKLAFVAAMLVTALLGNGLRVGLIITVAHLSGNIGDIADDHLFYGWLLFSALTFLLLALGQKYRQSPAAAGAIAAGTGFNPWPGRLIPLALLAVPVAGQLALPAPDQLRRQARPSCGLLAPARQAADPIDWPADQTDQIACSSAAGIVAVAVAIVDRPIRHSKLITWSNPWREDEAILIGRQDVVITAADQTLPARLELWSLAGRPRSVWTLIWSDGAWRRPGPAAAWADLRSDLRGRRHSAILRLSVDADSETAAPLIGALLAAAAPTSMIGF